MKKLLTAIRDAWRETKYRWTSYTYLSLDCKVNAHTSCSGCDCVCHGHGAPDASLESPNDSSQVIDRSA